jgi:hypothetical protein
MPRSLVGGYHSFGDTYLLYLQGRSKYIPALFFPIHDIHPENCNCNVCRNIAKRRGSNLKTDLKRFL